MLQLCLLIDLGFVCMVLCFLICDCMFRLLLVILVLVVVCVSLVCFLVFVVFGLMLAY